MDQSALQYKRFCIIRILRVIRVTVVIKILSVRAIRYLRVVMTKQKPFKQDGNFTYHQKATIVKYHSSHPSIKLVQIAQWIKTEFNLVKVPSVSTISRILSERDKFLNIAAEGRFIKRTRILKNKTLEEALVTYMGFANAACKETYYL